jgi:hypothetical protein
MWLVTSGVLVTERSNSSIMQRGRARLPVSADQSLRGNLLRCNVDSHSERSVELHLQHQESRIGAKRLIE